MRRWLGTPTLARSGRLALVLALAASAGMTGALERRAGACGGLFCNRPPDPFAPLPVAQNGENVVFAITKDPAGGAPTIAAHIQILYTGDAASFSWIVPVEAVPVLSTGTDRLFSQLASITQPAFIPDYQTSGTCLPDPQITTFPSGGGFATGAAGSAGAAGAGGGGVTIAFQGAVGPFDAAVIQSDDATALKTWLSDNKYTVSDAAGALIDTYVRENKFFVALKLLNGVGVKAIQPIVLTFRGTEPCVPLRLTAIAANPNMPVLVWVLSDKRVVPRGFYELKIDEARIDWWTNGQSYFGPQGLVSQAADDAGGNAFIAEYAGSSSIAKAAVYSDGQIDLTALGMAATPPLYVMALVQMGIANDPVMMSLLDKYIPMPDGVKAMNVSDSQFYGNLTYYWANFAFPAFDLAGLTDAISKSIVTPRIDAQTMLDAHPYLTRLNTYLSPEEMNQDAFFFESEDLPDVPNVHRATIRTLCGNSEYMACSAPQRVELSDGRFVWIKAGTRGVSASCDSGNYDVTALAKLPVAAVAWQRDTSGEGTRIVDNTAKIQAGIDANNAHITKGLSAATIGSAPAAGGAAGAGGLGAAGAGGGVTSLQGSSGGCGCDVSKGGGGYGAIALAAGLALRARRRRRGCAARR